MKPKTYPTPQEHRPQTDDFGTSRDDKENTAASAVRVENEDLP
jgi:hypothetical protein